MSSMQSGSMPDTGEDASKVQSEPTVAAFQRLERPRGQGRRAGAAFQRLEFAQQIRAYHHGALWEEQKHFTWLLSIVLAAQAAVLTADPTKVPARFAILAGLALFGLALVALALTVVRREGGFFVRAHGVYVKLYNVVLKEIDDPLPAAPAKPNKDIGDLPALFFKPDSQSIRDAFQLVLMLFGAVDLVILVAIALIAARAFLGCT